MWDCRQSHDTVEYSSSTIVQASRSVKLDASHVYVAVIWRGVDFLFWCWGLFHLRATALSTSFARRLVVIDFRWVGWCCYIYSISTCSTGCLCCNHECMPCHACSTCGVRRSAGLERGIRTRCATVGTVGTVGTVNVAYCNLRTLALVSCTRVTHSNIVSNTWVYTCCVHPNDCRARGKRRYTLTDLSCCVVE